MVLRLLTAFGLTFALGFERQIRGSVAGDRTFSLLGVGTAVIGVLSANGAPTIMTGAVTGVGFIGAGLLFRQADQNIATVHGVTTAASILAAAAIGAVAGAGEYLLAVVATVLVILALEFRYIPGLRLLDARRWAHHFKDDTDPHHGAPPAGVTIATPAQAHRAATTPQPRPNGNAELTGLLRPPATLPGATVSPTGVAQVAAVQSAITADADESSELGAATRTR
jgi:putative Mg2+ transporter-C (MgtC) family protein